jgi:hypothetical protein
MNTPTPETDKAPKWSGLFVGENNGLIGPAGETFESSPSYYERKTLIDLEDARKLEQERDEARNRVADLEAKLTALGNIAVCDWDDKTVGEVDDAVPPEKQKTYNDLIKSLFQTIPAERDQLRKVADELYYAQGFEEVAAARVSYCNLPHVKAK